MKKDYEDKGFLKDLDAFLIFFDYRRVFEKLAEISMRVDEVHQSLINRIEIRSSNVISDIGEMFAEFEDRVRRHIRDGYLTEEVMRNRVRLDEQQQEQWKKDMEMDRLWRKELEDDRRLLAEVAAGLRRLRDGGEEAKEKDEKKEERKNGNVE